MPRQRNLGAALKRLQRSRNMTVAQLADKIGATRQSVYLWFRGRGISPAFRGRVEKLLDRYGP